MRKAKFTGHQLGNHGECFFEFELDENVTLLLSDSLFLKAYDETRLPDLISCKQVFHPLTLEPVDVRLKRAEMHHWGERV